MPSFRKQTSASCPSSQGGSQEHITLYLNEKCIIRKEKQYKILNFNFISVSIKQNWTFRGIKHKKSFGNGDSPNP